MGVESQSFVDTYSDDVNAMKISIMSYLKTLRTKASYGNLPSGIGIGPGVGNEPKFVLAKTKEGYPILPPLESDRWRKRDWEALFTTYMGEHYSMYRQQLSTRVTINFAYRISNGWEDCPSSLCLHRG